MKRTCSSIVFSISLNIVLFIPQKSEAAEPVLWASSCLTKVLRPDMPEEKMPSVLQLSGARGEIVSGQAVFYPGENLDAATVGITDLQHKSSGKMIPADAVKVQWVRYIDINRNTGRFDGIPEDELVAKAPNSIPDPFWEDTDIPVGFGPRKLSNADVYITYNAQPVWIEIHIPRNAVKGDYTGTLTVMGGAKPVSLPVVLHVWNFELPEERHLSVSNWGSPLPYSKNVKPYSDKYWDQIGEYMDFIVEHRQTDLHSLNFDMIEEKGDEKQGYTYDTSILEHYVELAFERGLRQIHIGYFARYKDTNNLNPNAKIVPYEKKIRQLRVLEKLIKSRGWDDIFVVNIADEPTIFVEQTYAEVVDIVHEIAPSVKCFNALQAEYLGKLDIYCPVLGCLDHFLPRYKEVQREGSELWFYTCCEPIGAYPNNFIDMSLLKARVLPWITYLYDLDGFGFWKLRSWGDIDPYTQEGTSRTALPLGDQMVMYPGKNGVIGSVRYSAQRDGIQDYEYMWILEDKLRKIKERLGENGFWLRPRQRPLELCKRVIRTFTDYTRDPDVMLDTRRAIAEEIEALDSKPFMIVQTSPAEGTIIHGRLK